MIAILLAALKACTRRDPDFTVFRDGQPQLRRWWVIPRNRWFSIYFHHFMGSDNEVLHDHPWHNCSIVLHGFYYERYRIGDREQLACRVAGSVVFRRATTPHRIEMTRTDARGQRHEGECWSLFLTGPKLRSWGFHCPKGWVPWRKFVDPVKGDGHVGPGCGDLA